MNYHELPRGFKSRLNNVNRDFHDNDHPRCLGDWNIVWPPKINRGTLNTAHVATFKQPARDLICLQRSTRCQSESEKGKNLKTLHYLRSRTPPKRSELLCMNPSGQLNPLFWSFFLEGQTCWKLLKLTQMLLEDSSQQSFPNKAAEAKPWDRLPRYHNHLT